MGRKSLTEQIWKQYSLEPTDAETYLVVYDSCKTKHQPNYTTTYLESEASQKMIN